MNKPNIKRVELIAQVAAGIVGNSKFFNEDDVIDQGSVIDQATEIIDEIIKRENETMVTTLATITITGLPAVIDQYITPHYTGKIFFNGKWLEARWREDGKASSMDLLAHSSDPAYWDLDKKAFEDFWDN